jgi:hypothetical protein
LRVVRGETPRVPSKDRTGAADGCFRQYRFRILFGTEKLCRLGAISECFRQERPKEAVAKD